MLLLVVVVVYYRPAESRSHAGEPLTKPEGEKNGTGRIETGELPRETARESQVLRVASTRTRSLVGTAFGRRRRSLVPTETDRTAWCSVSQSVDPPTAGPPKRGPPARTPVLGHPVDRIFLAPLADRLWPPANNHRLGLGQPESETSRERERELASAPDVRILQRM